MSQKKAVKMLIRDVIWTAKMNVLVVECTCGHEFKHEVVRIEMKCPLCRHVNHWHEWPGGRCTVADVRLWSEASTRNTKLKKVAKEVGDGPELQAVIEDTRRRIDRTLGVGGAYLRAKADGASGASD